MKKCNVENEGSANGYIAFVKWRNLFYYPLWKDPLLNVREKGMEYMCLEVNGTT